MKIISLWPWFQGYTLEWGWPWAGRKHEQTCIQKERWKLYTPHTCTFYVWVKWTKTVWNQIRQINWTKTVWHFDGTPWISFEKKSTDKKSMQNFSVFMAVCTRLHSFQMTWGHKTRNLIHISFPLIAWLDFILTQCRSPYFLYVCLRNCTSISWHEVQKSLPYLTL